MEKNSFDIIISGAGPAGLCCALHLARSGYKIALIDKESFPKEKVCGDGLTGYVLFELHKLGEDYLNDFLDLPDINPITGMKVFSPNGYIIELENVFRNRFNNTLCHIVKRGIFEKFLFDRLKLFDNITVFESYKVRQAELNSNNVTVNNGRFNITGKMLAGADGANSFIKRHFFNYKPDWKNYHLTLQVYYKNLNDVRKKTIEAHMLREIIPGGLWIFPMKNNLCNVGMGILAKDIRKQNIDIQAVFRKLIRENTILKKTFKDAEELSKINIRPLPLGNRIGKVSETRLLLLGDAIPVVNPLTGEGIGEAMNTGRLAAEHIHNCFIKMDFSKEYMKNYDHALKKKFARMFRMSQGVQKFASNAFLLNRVAKNISRNKKLQHQIEHLVKDPENYQKLFDPLLYYRMIIP